MNKLFKKIKTITFIILFFIGFCNFMWLNHERPRWGGTMTQMTTVGYQINPNFAARNNLTQAQQITAIQNAANVWREQGFANFQFEFRGQTANTNRIPDCGNFEGRENTNFAETRPNPDLPNGFLAVTWTYNCGTNIIPHFEMRFEDVDFVWTQQNLQQIATHEFGHALGLSHCGIGQSTQACAAERPGTNPVPGMIMYLRVGETNTINLHPDDIAGIRALYGVRGAVPFAGNLIAIKKSATGSNSTEIHIVRGTANYQEYAIETGTILHETGATFDFAVWDVNRDGIMDIVAIKKASTGSNATEVHVLNGATNYQTYIYQTGTNLPETGSNWEFTVWDYDGNGSMDLIAIAKNGTGSGNTEVHVLNGSDNFTSFLLHSSTALEPNTNSFDFSVWDYNNDGKMDLIAVKKNTTGAGKTEVHILDGASNFNSFSLHAITPIEENTENFEFIPTFYPVRGSTMNIVAIKKFNTGSLSTEIHVLNGANNFGTFILQTASILNETGSNFDMEFWL